MTNRSSIGHALRNATAAALILCPACAAGEDWKDLASPEVRLPPARSAVAVTDDLLNRSMHIQLAPDGRYRANANEGWGPSVDLDKIRSWLAIFSNRAGGPDEVIRDEQGLSTRHVVIWADETSSWKGVAKLLILCGTPGIQMPNTWVAVRTANAPIAALPVPLPTDVGIGELRESIRLRVDRTVDLTAMREGPTATLTAWREKGWTDDEVMLVLQAEKLSGIERLSKMLADLREQIPEPNDGSNDIDINVELGSLCAHADFVRMADVSRAAGFNKVTFRTPESVSSAKARSTGRQVLGGGTGGRRPGVWGTSQQAKAARSTIDSGLSWLVGHQSDRGFWSSSSFSDRCDAEPCEGAGIETLDIGVTGLSLLALVKAGHSVNTGEHKTVVRKGVKYLMTIQDPETGCFGEVNSHTTFLYDHAIATLAVVEIYGGSKWPMLKKPAQKAVNFILSARNDTKAWRYAYPQNGSNDMSVSGWMAMALLQAKRYGLDVDEAAFDGVRAFITEMTDEVSGRTGYQKRGGLSDRSPNAKSRWPEANTEAMTALATICRLSLGESPDSDDILRGAALLRAQPPRWSIEDGTIDYSYWYFGTRAATAIGGATWSTWQKALEASALDEQKTDSHACGSWDPDVDPWGARGGRVYSTALMTLCLLEYGQHLP